MATAAAAVVDFADAADVDVAVAAVVDVVDAIVVAVVVVVVVAAARVAPRASLACMASNGERAKVTGRANIDTAVTALSPTFVTTEN